MSERSGTVGYADASALAKLVLGEPEAADFAERMSAHDRALGVEGSIQAALVLARLTLVQLTDEVRTAAAAIAPGLRTLDAIHLASALDPGLVEPFYCYDRRLCEAAAAAGLRVESPGA